MSARERSFQKTREHYEVLERIKSKKKNQEEELGARRPEKKTQKDAIRIEEGAKLMLTTTERLRRGPWVNEGPRESPKEKQ